MGKRKKILNQLEFDFELKSGEVTVKNTQLQFDFFNAENNFYAQVYKNKNNLKFDLQRLTLIGNISRKPVTRMLLFKTERTRQRVAIENHSTLKKYGIAMATI